MTELVPVRTPEQRQAFARIVAEIYRPWPQHRATEDDVLALLLSGRSAFLRHAIVDPQLILQHGRVVGRVVLVHDTHQPDAVQAAFFEALPSVHNLVEAVRRQAKQCFPHCTKLIVGLNGHLNYSAGILTDRFEAPPLFGFTWTPPYYPAYLRELTARPVVSYRFDNTAFYTLADSLAGHFDPGPVTVRPMRRSELPAEVARYTALNNGAFQQHPFWSDRTAAEDLELFQPFRWLLREENLLFAEVDGQPIGFLLWYPDFNELVRRDHQPLGPLELLRYRLANPIQTVRLTEIAVLPEYRRSPAVQALILAMIAAVRRGGYRHCEGGFIFEENSSCIGMTLRWLERALGSPLQPHRRFAVYEGPL